MTIKIIAAVSVNGIIGISGILPWQGKYKEDLQFFKKMTAKSTVIMGRKTYESIGKPLPNRRNIVISRIATGLGIIDKSNIEIAASIKDALDTCDNTKDVWLIGGTSIYEAGLEFVDEIYLTLIPEYINTDTIKDYAKFPWINPTLFVSEAYEKLSDDLNVIKYVRKYSTQSH